MGNAYETVIISLHFECEGLDLGSVRLEGGRDELSHIAGALGRLIAQAAKTLHGVKVEFHGTARLAESPNAPRLSGRLT